MRKQLAFLFLVSLCVSQLFAGDGKIRKFGQPVPGQYIITLASAESLEANAKALVLPHGGKVGYVWERLSSFVVELPEAAALALSSHPKVLRVEQNARIYPATNQVTNFDYFSTGSVPHGSNVFWNLDRIDQRLSALDSNYNYCTTGYGVKAYVIDSGILKTHREFWRSRTDTSTRVENGRAFTTNGAGLPFDRWAAPNDFDDYGTNPCNMLGPERPTYAALDAGGHGTSVASALGGWEAGVAKGVTLVPVKVMPCSASGGYVTDLIAGLDWVRQVHEGDVAYRNNFDPYYKTGKVANLSLFHLLPEYNPEATPVGENPYGVDITSAQLTTLEQAVQNLVASGVTVVVSANNQNMDARNTTPARLAYGNTAIGGSKVISVGGIMQTDTRWINGNGVWQPYSREPDTGYLRPDFNPDPGSNYGPAVDIFAPAHNLRVAHIENATSYRAFGVSGTSFAAPMMSGAVARYIEDVQKSGFAPDPTLVWTRFSTDATKDALSNVAGSANRLLYIAGESVCRDHPASP